MNRVDDERLLEIEQFSRDDNINVAECDEMESLIAEVRAARRLAYKYGWGADDQSELADCERFLKGEWEDEP